MSAKVKELLGIIRENIIACERGLRPSAEAIVKLRRLGMTVRAIADAVDYSPTWVQQLATWAESGFIDRSPFDRARLAAKHDRETQAKLVAAVRAEDAATLARGEKVFDGKGRRIRHTDATRRADGMQLDYVRPVNEPELEDWLETQVQRMVMQVHGYMAAKFAIYAEQHPKDIAIIETEKLAIYKAIGEICTRKLEARVRAVPAQVEIPQKRKGHAQQ